jgi:chemotaxis protein methyltransferase CheR
MTGPAELARFRAMLATRLGWGFDDSETPQLAHVLGKRADSHRLSRAGYLARLGAAEWDAELTVLTEELAVGETYFYRHSEQFRAVAEVALPDRFRARSFQRTLRMLSVGCSTGEEAYTLAIIARESRPATDWIISVLGLDANPSVLHRAMTARYTAWSLRETPDAIRQRWFHPCDGGYELDPMIRAAVQFRRYNVADEDPGLWHSDQYDVVFCRNLLMYLTPAVRATLVHRITRSLTPGGYLFLGHTDSLGSRPDGLVPQHTHRTFYYRRPAVTAPHVEPPATGHPPSAVPGLPPSQAPKPDRYDGALRLLQEERFAEAVELFEAEPADPSAPRELLLHSVLLAHSGRLDDAEMICRQLLDIDDLHADAHHQLAVCLDGGTAVDTAIGHYRVAAYLDPGFAMPRLRLGLLARRRGEERVATTELDRALALLRHEREERIVLFGGGFGRLALSRLCRAELDTFEMRR